jgi:hypothetical protein
LTDEVAAQKLLGIASDDDEESSLAAVEDQPVELAATVAAE